MSRKLKKTSSVLSSSNSSDDCSLGEKKPECKVNKPDSGRVTLSETDTSYRFTDCAEDQCVRQNVIMMLDFFFFYFLANINNDLIPMAIPI